MTKLKREGALQGASLPKVNFLDVLKKIEKNKIKPIDETKNDCILKA